MDQYIDLKLLPKKLKYLRVKQDLTQAEVAQKMGWGKSVYCRLEKGQRGLKVSELKKLNTIFGVDLLIDEIQ